MEHGSKARVLLVDDHPLVRDGLKKLIESQADLLVVGEASNEEDAKRIAAAVSADVALVDVSLPGDGGVKLTEAIVSLVPGIRVIGVTRHTEHAIVAKMFDAGAWGYVLKQSPSTEILRAIRLVASGQRFVDSALQRQGTPGTASSVVTPPPATREPLTPTEERVLRLVAAAYSNQEIAARLDMALSDIVAIKASGMKKTGLVTRTQVIAYAQARGWE